MVKYSSGGAVKMKMNYDCIRDVLLSLEEILSVEETTYDLGEGEETYFAFSFTDVNRLVKLDRLKQYNKKDIFYSVAKLNEAGFIEAQPVNGDNMCGYLISDITYTGHEFLQSIKSDTVWDNVKKISKKVGSISFPIISSIASSVLSKLITNSVGLS